MSHQGQGSTLVLYDLYLDEESNYGLALSPRKLHEEMRAIISDVRMKHRTGLLDVWEREDIGPATSFHSLEESHSRASVAGFARSETWPKELHVNGEVQLCNYSRDNMPAAKEFARLVIARFEPATAHLLVIVRGPGSPPRLEESADWKRGEPFPF